MCCVLTCFSSGGSLLHSLPSILVISGKGTSGLSALSCSRRSFINRTYPVNGALGALLSFIGFFLFLPLVQLVLRGFYRDKFTPNIYSYPRHLHITSPVELHVLCELFDSSYPAEALRITGIACRCSSSFMNTRQGSPSLRTSGKAAGNPVLTDCHFVPYLYVKVMQLRSSLHI